MLGGVVLMKINMGENIRKYRKNLDLTQEQLAEKLGTSVQSVSRWECGTTYPDIEMLPTIANIFHVTVNDLFYCDDAEKRKHCDELYHRLEESAEAGDIEKTVSVLKEICRGLAQFHEYEIGGLYHVLFQYRLEQNREVIEQLRRLTDEILLHCPRKKHSYAITWMAILEDEDHIQSFLDSYSSEEDISRTRLLLDRYRFLRDFEKHESVRKIHLWRLICEMVDSPANWERFGKQDPLYAVWYNQNNLAYLHQFCHGTTNPEFPLSGNGKIDLFFDIRLELGLDLISALVGVGQTDEAFAVMDDLVSLAEKISAVNEDSFVLSCASPALEDFTGEARFEWEDGADRLQYRQVFYRIDRWEGCWMPQETLSAFRNRFSSLHSDSRYEAYFQRISACVVTRPKPE